jgi:hypothetical protein
VVFERWVTPEDADADLIGIARLNSSRRTFHQKHNQAVKYGGSRTPRASWEALKKVEAN